MPSIAIVDAAPPLPPPPSFSVSAGVPHAPSSRQHKPSRPGESLVRLLLFLSREHQPLQALNWVACVCVNTIKIPLTRAELSRIKKTGARCQLLVFFFDNININSGSGKRRRKISGHFGTLHIKASAMRRVAEVVEPPTWIPIQLIWLSPQRGPDVKHLIVSVSFLFFFFLSFFFLIVFFSSSQSQQISSISLLLLLAEFESIDGLPPVSGVKHEVTPCGVQPLFLSASPLPCRILRSPESFMLAQRSVDPLGFFFSFFFFFCTYFSTKLTRPLFFFSSFSSLLSPHAQAAFLQLLPLPLRFAGYFSHSSC